MTIIRDFIDPKSTKRLNKNLILISAHIFRPVAVTERPYKVYLSLNICSNNVYSIFSLFFINDVLKAIAKNTNKYTC